MFWTVPTAWRRGGSRITLAAVALCRRFGSEYVGIADAANVVLAATYRTSTFFTLDQRHFRALAPLTSEAAFTLLPYDA